VKNFVALLALCAACLLPARSGAAAPAIESLTLNGVTYYRARAWAAANGLEPAWVVRDKTLQLANAAVKIQLTVNSERGEFNGLTLAFSRPVAYENGAVYFSKLDADTVLAPLLSPPRISAGKKIKTICLDPGHGGRDPGYVVGSKQEKKYTLLLAQEVRDLLTKQGFKVVMTRKRDTFPELSDRADTANRAGADLFVSLHFNAFIQDKSVNGAETYCLTPAGASSSNAGGVGAGTGAYRGNANNRENINLAYQLQKSLVRSASSEDRGVKRARFQVLREVSMPAALIETGFMSNTAEGKRIFDTKSRKAFAKAIADGIVAYKRTVERGS
jgi:N-acetylmuramoyl-L-alanine amidase